MPQITITVSELDLLFLDKLASESKVKRSEKARELLRIGINSQVSEVNSLAVFLSMEDKRKKLMDISNNLLELDSELT